MRLTIFSRLIIGYLAVFSLMMMVSGYAIWNLHRLNQATDYLVNIDQNILDGATRLLDSFAVQQRFEQKYLGTRDKGFHQEFLLEKKEFGEALGALISIADTPRKQNLLDKIEKNHGRYHSIISEEVTYHENNQPYPSKKFAEEKERAAEAVMQEVEKLEAVARRDIHARMKKLGEAGSSAWRAGVGMGIGAIVVVIATSLLTTRSVTQPLHLLVGRTREVAEGVFKEDLKIPSPPEVSELAQAFNTMCGKLKTLDRMKSDFFSTLSHELRTPLASIREGTNLLLEGVGGAVTEKQKRLLTILSEESSRLIDLVNSSLDLSKIEAGMMTYQFEPGNLRLLVEKASQEVVPLLERKKIKLETNLEKELPVMRMDRERILQVLRNLIGNAVKFTPEGGQVKILARPAEKGAEISVADTGPGIPEKNLATIFEKYRQASPSESHRVKGTGLGLAIARNIVASHGGKIWAQSEAGKGSIFTFWLPA